MANFIISAMQNSQNGLLEGFEFDEAIALPDGFNLASLKKAIASQWLKEFEEEFGANGESIIEDENGYWLIDEELGKLPISIKKI